MSKRRVVVTGMGIISPVGNDIATAWRNVVEGVSGIGPITDFDVADFSTRFGGGIKGFNADSKPLAPGEHDYSELSKLLVENGHRLTRLTEEEINLETAFMALTKGITS